MDINVTVNVPSDGGQPPKEPQQVLQSVGSNVVPVRSPKTGFVVQDTPPKETRARAIGMGVGKKVAARLPGKDAIYITGVIVGFAGNEVVIKSGDKFNFIEAEQVHLQ